MAPLDQTAILPNLQPARRDSGLRVPGYYIWCSSVIHVDDTWHMFSSRWPERTPEADAELDRVQVLQNYIDESEIVHATSATPEGPYTFREVVLRPRGGDHWDHHCCHNPYIVQSGNTFVLFFQTCTAADKWDRRIGYATATNIDGPWTLPDAPLDFGTDATNPAVWVEPDGGALLLFRAPKMRLVAARADSFAGPYQIVNEDLMPGISLEDPFVWNDGKCYHVLLEDNRGQLTGHVRHGVHLVSDDGAAWQLCDAVPRAYTHTIEWADGTTTTMDRRERPWLLLEDGQPTHLVTGVLHDRRAWSVVQEIDC